MDSLKISNLSKKDISLIEGLLTNSSFNPYRYIGEDSNGSINRYWLRSLVNQLEDKNTETIVMTSRNNLVGVVSISGLPWDSQVLNTRMASVNLLLVDQNLKDCFSHGKTLLNHAIKQMREREYKFLLCKVHSDNIFNIHILEESGFLLVDTQLVYAVDFRTTQLDSILKPKVPEDCLIRFAKAEDEQELVALANTAFQGHFGRYHSDPKLSRDQATAVYAEWIRSSLRGYADYIIVANIDGRIAGLSIWRNPTDLERTLPAVVGHYSIGAVHPDFSGKNIFTHLTYEGMKLFESKVDIIEGPTHINNHPVQRGYSRLKWKIFDARHSFHLWI